VPIDNHTFKQVMRHWASGITVVTCRRPGGIHGMTASSFCSLSLEPPLLLVCIDRRNRTHDYIREQGSFGVHLLGSDMTDLSDRCAGFLGEEGHWLQDVEFHTEVTGAPVLDRALAWMDCSVWQIHDGGDHSIYVGEIQAAGEAEGSPLLWFDRGYHRLAE
jgi:flavin reductase (DIM6/NTAB) family NADH-FMN oxidoreductase RutF